MVDEYELKRSTRAKCSSTDPGTACCRNKKRRGTQLSHKGYDCLASILVAKNDTFVGHGLITKGLYKNKVLNNMDKTQVEPKFNETV
jgi:hypothetical protein